MPPEILETLAHANYNTPRPRPIDPAVFFDLVKIRRLVDDATNLAVRAASGIASSALSSMGNAPHHNSPLGLGFDQGGGRGHTKLSRERKHRMREQATQKLSKAYHLDEIASSVATMQSTSTLEDVASLVLQRSKDDADAKYVHFFHEKIPSRQLAESTSLGPLDEVIASRPTEGEPLRTRATVRVFKEDYERAARDFTEALRVHRLYRAPHTAPKSHTQEFAGHEVQQPRGTRRHEDVVLREEEQPSSLEIQLLFQRAGVYLAIACQHVKAALIDPRPLSRRPTAGAEAQNGNGEAVETGSLPELSPAEQEAERALLEEQKSARKLVKTNAKRALRDYMAYLSHFEYSPDLPIETVEDFARKVNQTANGIRIPRSQPHMARPTGQVVNGARGTDVPYHLYSLSELFAASPPAGLPPYPRTDMVPARQPPAQETTAETLTYHPLLTDALHSFLLCHCLAQTSAKELLRHAYMVARLARLADGYPVFQASRSPARADWIEVLRRGDNWIQLSGAWESLCAPAPLPLLQGSSSGAGPPPSSSSSLPAKQPKALLSAAATADGALDEQQQQQHRVTDDDLTFRAAVRARQMRAEEDYRLNEAVAALDAKLMAQELGHDASAEQPAVATTHPTTAAAAAAAATATPAQTQPPPASPQAKDVQAPAATTPTTATPATATAAPPAPGPRRWAVDDGREYPILTERAGAVARWVREAPPNAGSVEGGAGPERRRRRRGGGAGGAGRGGGRGGAGMMGMGTVAQGVVGEEMTCTG